MSPEGRKIEKGQNKSSLLEIWFLFLKLGVTAFGGPAAHIARMHEEVVERRRWLDNQQFLDLLGATNLIPGPNSTEVAIHLGFLRGGWAGLILGGAGFILPSTLIVIGLSWAYVQYQTTPVAGWLLWGIKPVVIAVIIQALWLLGRTALKDWASVAAGVASLIFYFLGFNEILLLWGGGLLIMLFRNIKRLKVSSLQLLFPIVSPELLAAFAVQQPFSLPTLFLTFLKIGAVLYGSGYILLAFLRADFVERLGWLTEQQLIDAVAIGQFTPGPLSTTATFIGYLLGGIPGAVLGTLGMFLPSFLFVAASNPLIPKMRASPWLGPLLDGVIAVSLGLMVGVTIELGIDALSVRAGSTGLHLAGIDLVAVFILLVATIGLIRYKINSTWLILAGAAAGLLRTVFF